MTTESTTSSIRLLAISILLCTLSVAPVLAQQDENLDVFSRWAQWSDPGQMLVHTLNDCAFKHLDRRDAEVASLNSLPAWQARQRKVRMVLDSLVGPFPAKTPLNAKVTGITRKDGYRIEKVLFESQPEFYVTGCLF
ncbi:xylan esterase, partial [Gemmatimonadota bacterium]